MRRASLLAAALLVATSLSQGAEPAPDLSPDVEMPAPPASDGRLDRLRGGADIGSALHIAFGLDRLTAIDGAVVSATRFEVQDIAHVTPAEAVAMQQSLGSVLMVTNGHVALAPLPAGNQTLGTVIQNSLPNQSIRNIVTVDIATNGLALLRAANAADQLRNLSVFSR